jgi:coronin-1B/1C/6
MASGNDRSKFRHIYGEPSKQEESYLEFKNPLVFGEGSYVAANEKFFAVARASGGGPLYVVPISQTGRISADYPLIDVHKGKAWDFQFHPFIPNMIASASDDMTVALTQFPDDGPSEPITEPRIRMEGHSKKAILLDFNPVANNILASGAFDRTVKVWNVETASAVNDYTDFGDTIFSLQWNGDGSMLGTTAKDRVIRLFDPRQPEAALTIPESFAGTKSSKIFWSPRNNWIGATGFNKTSKQELKIWDLANLGADPIADLNFGQDSSVLMPFYDNDLSILYLYGKGNGMVHYYELNSPDGRVCYQLSSYRATNPQKGGGWLPKKACDVWKCEVARFFKLTNKDVIPVSFMVPRKAGADIFQEDIYPDAPAGVPGLSADEWLEGQNAEIVRMPMDPARRGEAPGGGAVEFVAKKSYKELEAENAELRARIQNWKHKSAEVLLPMSREKYCMSFLAFF